MFGLGVPELLFILLLALLIFGPKKLPQIGRTLGKGMAEFRRASTELQRTINTDLEPRDEPAPRPAGSRSREPSPERDRDDEHPALEAGEGPTVASTSGDDSAERTKAVSNGGEGEDQGEGEDEASPTPTSTTTT